MKGVIFDIETGPLPAKETERFMPKFEAPSNYKDQAKIDAFIEEKRAEWIKQSALNATSGKILAIGCLYSDSDEPMIFGSGQEAEDLASAWQIMCPDGYISYNLVGFNSNSFDIPFMVRRSWALGVKVPKGLATSKWLPSECRDLLDVWRIGNRQESVSLATMSRFFGVGEKSGEGKDFFKLWASDRATALKYLAQDLVLTKACAQRMGVL